MIFRSEKCSPWSKIEPRIVVAAEFDDLSDRFFVRSRRSFALLIERVHLHLLLCHKSHGHITLQVSPCVPRDLTMHGAAAPAFGCEMVLRCMTVTVLYCPKSTQTITCIVTKDIALIALKHAHEARCYHAHSHHIRVTFAPEALRAQEVQMG
jgi:hypothetical protein